MEFNFNQNDDFEEFLQNQLRNQRMYPGDRVWKNIHQKLHGHKRWPALTLAASLIFGTAVFICCYFAPKPNIFTIKPHQYPTISQDAVSARTPNTTSKTTGTLAPSGKNNTIGGVSASKNKKGTSALPLSTYRERNVNKALLPPPTIALNSSLQPGELLGVEQEPIIREPAAERFNTPLLPFSHTTETANSPKILLNEHKATNEVIVREGELSQQAESKAHKNTGVASAVIASPKIFRNRWSYLLYVAPSISYRNLFEDRSMLKTGQSGPVGINYVTDVNSVVRHKPGAGIEAGVSIMYNYTGKLRIKSGLQFNVRQYNIEAYRSSTELASIALMEDNHIDTVNSVAVYRNNNGYSSAELTNRYYQLSLPIGIEWEVIGNRHVQINIAGSIQPTYLLNHNAYLLSTNFKNYTEDPGMVKSWNFNSNIETFISFHVGDFKWQLGPQLRYQPYSTFISQYPIKEHLLDYGFKIGLSKIIK